MGRARHQAGTRVQVPDGLGRRERDHGLALDLTPEQVATVVRRVCTSKRPIRSPLAARHVAEHVRRRTARPIAAYRCPFAGSSRASVHWHIGHVPSLASLKRIAAAIRVRAQGLGVSS
jgi:hypothetical protein